MAVIETQGLTKTFGDTVAINDLDLVVEEGEVFGFLGPNGAGKSTTINLLLDFVRPTSGRADVLGYDAQEESQTIRQRIGVLPEGYGFYERLSGRRHVAFAIEWKDATDTPEEVLDNVGLDPADADRAVGEYSKGMQQRLALGMALVGDPELLVLDEPSSGLDPNGIREMRDLARDVAAAGNTVFFSSHLLGQVEAVCDRVGILADGELVAVDTVDGLREAVGTGSVLHLRMSSPPAVELTDIAGVERVTHEDGRLSVSCSDPGAKAQVVSRLTNGGTVIRDIDSESASLEDVFAYYTTADPERTTARRKTEDREVVT